MRDNNKRRVTVIAVTGGPCGGKSTFLAKGQQFLENHGMKVAVLPETATELIQAGLTPWSEWEQPTDFQAHLLGYQLSKEATYLHMLRRLTADKPLVLLCDRGANDGEAYVGKAAFETVAEALGHTPFSLREGYQMVVHLVTAADGAEQYYTLENNKARTEGLEEALALDRKTLDAWTGHQHLFIINNSTDFNEKVRRAIASVARVLHMPEPLEMERKYLHLNWDPEVMKLPGTVAVEILQDYLTFGPGRLERRVRKRTVDGSAPTYYYTEKKPELTPGVRPEVEKGISEEHYKELLREKDPDVDTIWKTRYVMVYETQVLEVDHYHHPPRVMDRVYLEVEVRDMSVQVHLPAGWNCEEVTGNYEHSNRSLAAKCA